MIDCPNCYRRNNDNAIFCECGYRLKYYNVNSGTKKDSHHQSARNSKNNDYSSFTKSLIFSCTICGTERNVKIEYEFDAFACPKCRSIFSYSYINKKCEISIVKRERNIPEKIKLATKDFDIEIEKLNLDSIKIKYRELLTKYHPDKVSHLANEFQIMAEEKTKKINEAYAILIDWLEANNDKK